MNEQAVESVLTERLEAEQKGDEFHVPKSKDVTALLKTGAELLHVPSVRIVEFVDDGLTLVTKQSEYFVDASDIFALKLEGSRIQPHDARPGFRRE